MNFKFSSMQIRSRLTLQFMLIVAGIMLIAMLYIHFQFKNHLHNELFDNLRSKALMTAEMVVGKEDRSSEIQPYERPGELSNYTENISIYDLQFNRIYSFNPLPDDIESAILKEIALSKESRFIHGKYCSIGVLFTNKAGSSFIVIAESVFNPEHLANLTQIIIWVFCILIALVAVGGWIFAGQALAPVSRIMNQVDALLPTDMSQRLETSNQQDELSRLVVTFNKLLDRIQQVFNTQKLFLSNISHELKNPLNIIISQIEIILDKERSKEEYRQTLASVLEDAKELNEVSNKLMQLAKINSDGTSIEFEQLRIDEMIWQTKATLLKSHPEYKISFEVVNLPEEEEKLFFKGNEQLMKTALLNLMENGCKFSRGKTVKVRLSFSEKGIMSIEIQDKGPGIPEDELSLVFEPFYRSPKTSNVKGSGIGLSLVNSIMKLHHIHLQVASLDGSGTTFKLNFSNPEIEN